MHIFMRAAPVGIEPPGRVNAALFPSRPTQTVAPSLPSLCQVTGQPLSPASSQQQTGQEMSPGQLTPVTLTQSHALQSPAAQQQGNAVQHAYIPSNWNYRGYRAYAACLLGSALVVVVVVFFTCFCVFTCVFIDAFVCVYACSLMCVCLHGGRLRALFTSCLRVYLTCCLHVFMCCVCVYMCVDVLLRVLKRLYVKHLLY